MSKVNKKRHLEKGKSLSIEYKAKVVGVDIENKTATVVVSDNSVDSYGEIVDPGVWKKAKTLERYNKHPVLLADHNYYNIRSVIGEKLSHKSKDNEMEMTFKYYAGEGNEIADWAWFLVQQGIASYSIGFDVFDWEMHESGSEKKVSDRHWVTLTDIELHETSQVTVPANMNALQRTKNFGSSVKKSLADQMLTIFESNKGNFSENYTKAFESFKDALYAHNKKDINSKSVDSDEKTVKTEQSPESNKSIEEVNLVVETLEKGFKQLSDKVDELVNLTKSVEKQKASADSLNNKPPLDQAKYYAKAYAMLEENIKILKNKEETDNV